MASDSAPLPLPFRSPSAPLPLPFRCPSPPLPLPFRSPSSKKPHPPQKKYITPPIYTKKFKFTKCIVLNHYNVFYTQPIKGHKQLLFYNIYLFKLINNVYILLPPSSKFVDKPTGDTGNEMSGIVQRKNKMNHRVKRNLQSNWVFSRLIESSNIICFR